MLNAEQLLYATEKSSQWSFSVKTALKNFVIFTGKHQCEILKNTCFEEDIGMAGSQLTLLSDCQEICF